MFEDEREDEIIDFSGVRDGGDFKPAPVGTHLCRLTVTPCEPIGSKGNRGFRVKATVVTPENFSRVAEDVLFTSPKALFRLFNALKQVAGIQETRLGTRAIRAALDGKLARITVGKVVWTVKGETASKGSNITEISEEDALKLRAAGVTVYARSHIAGKDGYAAPKPEELAEYGHLDSVTFANGKIAEDSDTPF